MSTTEESAAQNAAGIASTATVTFDHGGQVTFDLSRPLYILKASKLESANDVEAGLNTLWVAAGQPDGSLEQWLETVAKIEMNAEENPTTEAPSE